MVLTLVVLSLHEAHGSARAIQPHHLNHELFGRLVLKRSFHNTVLSVGLSLARSWH